MTAVERRKSGWTWEDVHYCSAEYKVRKARKERPCASCEHPIEPGQRYVHIVWAFPWTLIADDVDDEGRPVGSPAGEWIVSNVHHSCLRDDER